jgi:hypothetical protein
VTTTGIIWSRYATQITPVNYNLLTVNAFMALTGLWHLGRVVKARYGSDGGAPAAAPVPAPVVSPSPAAAGAAGSASAHAAAASAPAKLA